VSDPLRPNRHFVVGVIILLLGVILLLDQLGFADARKIFLFWPLILIYFGVNKLVTCDDMVGRFWGGFLALLGLSFQLEELGLSRIHFGTIWPVFLICVGVLLVLRRYENRGYYAPPPPPPDPASPTPPGSEPPIAGPPPPPSAPPQTPPPQATADTSAPGVGQANWAPDMNPNSWPGEDSWRRFQHRMDRFSERVGNKWQPPRSHWQPASNWYDSSSPRLDDVNVFWGGRRRITSKNFMGGDIVAIFGGFEIDLTQADFSGNQIVIEVVTIFGGGEIRVPTNWEVIVDSVGIFGGTSDRTSHPQPQNQDASRAGGAVPVKRLIVKGVSIFGGLTLKN
jgi:Cell wall-active antibiotics response 4TMS YvqF/Domain of unknown function (DUF5668)